MPQVRPWESPFAEASMADPGALPSWQQHAQAGDAAFELLELADVDDDRGEAQVVEQVGGPRRGRGDQDAVTADFRCSTLPNGTATTVRPSGASNRRSWRMPSPSVRPPRPTYTVVPTCRTVHPLAASASA